MSKYIVIIYTCAGVLRREVEAETYWDAVAEAAPGNDAIKVEVVAV